MYPPRRCVRGHSSSEAKVCLSTPRDFDERVPSGRTDSLYRKLGDHTYLSWNNVPSSKHPAGSSTAMASGRDLGPTGGV